MNCLACGATMEDTEDKTFYVLTSASSMSSVVESLRPALIDQMDFPVYIVPLGKVRPEVAAPALLSAQRGPRDQTTDRGQMQTLPGIVGERRSLDAAPFDLARRSEFRDSVPQSLARSEKTGRAPHQVTHFTGGQGLEARG